MRNVLRSGFIVTMAGAIAVLTASCSDPASSAAAPPAAPTNDISVQQLALAYDKPAVVGARVTASATGLPAGRMADLQWGTVTGGWVI